MTNSLTFRRVLVFAAVLVLVGAALTVAGMIHPPASDNGLPRVARDFLDEAGEAAEAAKAGESKPFEEMVAGSVQGGAASESAEAATIAAQWAEARTAPGIVAPGAYSTAFAQLTALTPIAGTWTDVTAVRYDADDPMYRDYYSNSSGGSGLVTGRITALAADNSGHVYVGGADGGVWRSSQGGGNWTPIADSLPSLSSGDLQIAAVDGALWYATGEANTGGTSYVGSGVYRLASPTSGTFAPSDRVGGTELESTTINALRFDGRGKVWAATLRGVWSHADNTNAGPWTLAFAPNPAFMPGGASAGDPNAAYKNIVNDIAVDPANASHIIAAAGWRNGDAYNGFYESKDAGATWTKVNPGGAINPKDIGNVSFAWSSDGQKLYVMNQSPILLQKPVGTVNSYLDGIYVSNSGSIAGPYTKIAESTKLANAGSALKQSVGGKGYGPGIQSWYNQFLLVDPTDANHVYAGLEEIYETKNGGSTWTTVGPYWNFYFPCWAPDSLYPPNTGTPNRCPQTTHPDQHSAAVGTYNGVKYFFAGNDGGVYRRPLNGSVNKNGNATDWQSLNDGTIDALQYYAVGIGNANGANPRTPAGSGVIISGGLQDNGGSIYRIGGAKMSSNFGGDGGDVLVDPNDGCNILQEYVVLSLSVTQTCANPDPVTNPNAFLDLSQSTTFKVAPPDINARFIAPFVADAGNINNWLAGGNSIWFQKKGFAIRSGSEWTKVYTFADPTKVATAMAYNGEWAIAGWCGTCNNSGFTRGIAVGHYVAGVWTWTQPVSSANLEAAGIPNRYVGGAAVDGSGNLYVVMNGFSRRFTEGPGAGVGHVFKSTDHGATWTSLDNTAGGDFPDVPANSIKVLSNGGLVVGTDLGVVYRTPGPSGTWFRLGTALPVTVTTDVEVGPDGYLYAATHGRGIWRFNLEALLD
ncbi:MAG: glycosyl hydrolase [Chloroflexi bacterium]|nr:glycosyl hydrolase [Chloroflexota bacterium]